MKQNIIANIYRIQAYESIMCGYACIGFIGSMLKGKNLLDYFLLTKSLKYHIFVIKHYFSLVFVTIVEVKIKKYFK